MKTGLVLEGGAMRGMFTAGVLDTFLDNDIKMDSVVGVSAGALSRARLRLRLTIFCYPPRPDDC